MRPTHDLRVKQIVPLLTPRALKAELPMSEASNATVAESRDRIAGIINQKDARLLVIVGPCSIHEIAGALEYANKLNVLRKQLADRMEIVMRVYFEKPRTTLGWKGLINDPHLNGSHDIETGLKLARKLLLDITGMGLAAATEFVDSITPQYIADLVSWAAIGARTTESQIHREMASGLSMPVGFKNSTDGSLEAAVNAMKAARSAHSFLGIDQDGLTSIVRTTGNLDGHIVLRGGRLRPNYDPQSIAEAERQLEEAGLPKVLMVDCSHANAGKRPERQEIVWQNVIQQRVSGTRSLIGMMLESYLKEGNQPFPRAVSELEYGVSITDPCISWETTERLLMHAYEKLAEVTRAG